MAKNSGWRRIALRVGAAVLVAGAAAVAVPAVASASPADDAGCRLETYEPARVGSGQVQAGLEIICDQTMNRISGIAFLEGRTPEGDVVTTENPFGVNGASGTGLVLTMADVPGECRHDAWRLRVRWGVDDASGTHHSGDERTDSFVGVRIC